MDKNGDGIGDIAGIIEKLDYVKGMGFDGIWFNPFFLSPFMDGGYDISDYKKIDPRFGSNYDAYKMIDECHKRGLLVIFDLVAGHTSWEAPLFKKSAAVRKSNADDMYIWSDTPWIWTNKYPMIKGLFQRNGAFMVNFFVHQPALNYGFSSKEERWMDLYDDDGPKKVREYIIDVMKFWCSHGVDGYRCDMADSLVKNDTPDKELTRKTWNEMFSEVRKEYPNMVAVSEWSNPRDALRAGFDMDFILDHHGNFLNLFFRHGENENGPWSENDKPLLKQFNQEIYDRAINDLRWRYDESIKNDGNLAPITGNHDTWRLASFLKDNELKDAFLMVMTLPGVPFVFAGDELGQKHVMGYPSKDGGFQRTGSRWAMNWNDSKKNGGFSRNDDPYLPTYTKCECAKKAMKDESSLYSLVKTLNGIRKSDPDFSDNENFRILDQPFCYERGKTLIAINIKDEPMRIKLEKGHSLLTIGNIEFLSSNEALLSKNAALVFKKD